MKKSAPKKATDRRQKTKKGRGQAQSQGAPRKNKPQSEVSLTSCRACGKDLSARDARALYVEEEVGRIFCTEDCIAEFFTPEIERLEKEYFGKLSRHDLTAEERESLEHLRWVTLQEPDEVWREKTLSGDSRYTLIAEFIPGNTKIWCVCICLFLKGEPSFLYLSFPTRNQALVNFYRRGERMEWNKAEAGRQGKGRGKGRGQPRVAESSGSDDSQDDQAHPTDRLADAWTEDETFLATMSRERRPDDIPMEDYNLYQSCMEETLETPDEVWSVRVGGESTMKLYHFIRHYPNEKPGIWFVIVAREIEDNEEQIEVVDAFPTKDGDLVEQYRKGEQEVGQAESRPSARVVH